VATHELRTAGRARADRADDRRASVTTSWRTSRT
jgi:hypothetical protein